MHLGTSCFLVRICTKKGACVLCPTCMRAQWFPCTYAMMIPYCRVGFQPFNRSYSQLTFFIFL